MSRRRQHPATERELCDAVSAAFLERGWLVPTTAAAVAAAEERLGEDGDAAPGEGPAPFSQVLAAPPLAARAPLALFPEPGPVEDTLARAAREGGPLSPEVEEAMRRDRAAAEERLQARAKGAPDP